MKLNLTDRISKVQSKKDRMLNELKRSQSRRLFFGLNVFFFLTASQVLKGFYLEWIALLVLFPLFYYFLKQSRHKKKFYDSLECLQNFYQKEEDFKQGKLVDPVPVDNMSDTNLARDLDLHLLLPQVQRCFSIQGHKKLNDWLCQKSEHSTRAKRQSYMQELILFPGLVRRIQLHPTVNLVDFKRIEKEVSRGFFPEKIAWKWIVPISWVLTFFLLFLPTPDILWKITLLTYIGSMLTYLKHTSPIFTRMQDLHSDFSELHEKIDRIELLASRLSFLPFLKKKHVSRDIHKLDRLISLMSLKTNPILFYILNLIVPWDFILAELCEKARLSFQNNFKSWSKEIIELEALSSLANLNIYHDTHWAEEKENAFLSFSEVSHPLINQNTIVTNDFNSFENKIFIITGSNMSGKSTFLRAVGINFCLAQIGAPVFAKNFYFESRQIVSCIRVSDSLRDGQSYFYAEVKRMKHILDLAKEEKVFFLIDEPLRGTNNKERLIGNQRYLKATLNFDACGFISTHDLELTQLSQTDPRIINYHFSEKWDEEDLVFDYKIKEGPSKSTNALKILAREGL